MGDMTHKVTEEIQEFDEVSNHVGLRPTFGIVEYDMCTTEPSWLAYMFKGGVNWLRISRAGI